MKTIRKMLDWFACYMYTTWANKLVAIILILISFIPILLDRDGTFLALVLIFAIPLFFSRKTWVG